MSDLEVLARRHGVSVDAVRVLQQAVQHGGGRMAQFSHPELGGMGQWSAGGMTQVGDMFNSALRDRVAALCAALAGTPHDEERPRHDGERPSSGPEKPKQAGSRDWWPDELGRPSASGGQNGMRYACFPDCHRVATEQAGVVTLYDSGDHRIMGVSQAQGVGQSLLFTSQLGTVRAEDLSPVG